MIEVYEHAHVCIHLETIVSRYSHLRKQPTNIVSMINGTFVYFIFVQLC